MAKFRQFSFLITLVFLGSPSLLLAKVAGPYNYLLQNGIFSPVYGELSFQTTDEFGGRNTLLNFQFGIQTLRLSEHSVALGYIIRGFNHGHTKASQYKVKLDGVNLDYKYAEYNWRPHFGLSYLIGEKKENETEDKEIIHEVKKFEIQAALGYFIPLIEGEVLLGYNYSMSRTNTLSDTVVEKKRVVETLSRDEAGNFSSLIVGVRFSGF